MVLALLIFGLNLFSIISGSVSARADQMGIVRNSPAYIYEKPDFDSKMVAELRVGTKIHISTKKWGPFFRTQTLKGVVGYVSDGDVQRTSGKVLGLGGGKDKSGKKISEPEAPRLKDPWWTAKALGIAVSYIQYSELVAKKQYQEAETDFGIKYSFPFRLIDGPFHMDLNALVHLSAPGYYSGLASQSGSSGSSNAALPAPSGYYVAVDAPLFYTFGHFWLKDGSFDIGIGPMVNFSNYSVAINGVSSQLQQTRVGAVVDLGIGFKLGHSMVVRVDPRYYIEQSNYMAVLASLQLLL